MIKEGKREVFINGENVHQSFTIPDTEYYQRLTPPNRPSIKHINIWFYCVVINIAEIVFVHIVLKRREDFWVTKMCIKDCFDYKQPEQPDLKNSP